MEKKSTLGGSLVASDIAQIHLVVLEQAPFLVVLRKNQHLEVIYNFSETLFVESRMNVARILGSFGTAFTYQFNDGSIAYASSLEKLHERNYMRDTEYYHQLLLPPVGTV
jgi:hypothetical protein